MCILSGILAKFGLDVARHNIRPGSLYYGEGFTSDKIFLNISWLFHASTNRVVYRKAISKTKAHWKHFR